MNGFDQFQATKPRLLIGQAVRVVGQYESDWRGETCLVTGMRWDGPRGRWNIEIMTLDEIQHGNGATDGWSEADLVEAHHTKETPTDVR